MVALPIVFAILAHALRCQMQRLFGQLPSPVDQHCPRARVAFILSWLRESSSSRFDQAFFRHSTLGAAGITSAVEWAKFSLRFEQLDVGGLQHEFVAAAVRRFPAARELDDHVHAPPAPGFGRGNGVSVFVEDFHAFEVDFALDEARLRKT